jgi:basic membrane protein A
VRSIRRSLALLGVAVLGVHAAGCGGGGRSEPEAGAKKAAVTTTVPKRRIEVGLVTSTAGLGDRALNQGAYRGLLRAERELGIEGRVLTSKSAADYADNLSTLAQSDPDLVVGVGSLMAGAVDAAARRFPDASFAIVDVSQSALAHEPPNVRGLLFHEEQSGYLAGYLAGLVVADQGGPQVVSTVGGRKVAAVDRYIAGFQAGARAANQDIRTLNGYSDDFVDQAKCKEIALSQIEQGAQVVMQVAGRCGLGALDAAREKGVWGIGADSDQSLLGPHVLTSALKLTDVAMFTTIESVRRGTFRGATDTVFDVASGAVGLGRISPRIPDAIVGRTKQVQADMAAGKVASIPTTVR